MGNESSSSSSRQGPPYPGAGASSNGSVARGNSSSTSGRAPEVPPRPQQAQQRQPPPLPPPRNASTRTAQPTQGSANAKPGAYAITGQRTHSNGEDRVPYTVSVPENVRVGQEFHVMAGGVPMMVRCPEGVRPGERIMVMVPRTRHPQVYMATVPQGVQPGGTFNVLINGRSVAVPCPAGVRPGMQIRIKLPEGHNQAPQPNTLQQTFEVTVPQGVRPGQPFALIANGQRVMVHCPSSARPGEKIRFQLPIQLSEAQLKTYNIHYNKDGWIRCVGTDLKFHWSYESAAEAAGEEAVGGAAAGLQRLGLRPSSAAAGSRRGGPQAKGAALNLEGFAFVRRLTRQGSRQWGLDFVRAEEAVLEASVPEASLTFQTLSRKSQEPFQAKVAWFQQQCDALRVPWDDEHQHIKIRRINLLDDSMHAINMIRPEQMRQRFRFEFIGEPAVDAGGVAREWFHLNSEQLTNPDFALFQYSSINQMCMQLNPASGIANDEHLHYFRFAGRLLGKALFDGQLVSAHLARPLYKHLLGWPIMFSDLEHIDHFTHDALLKMTELEDVEVCCLDFTVTEDRMGGNDVIELKPGGADVTVTNENLREYVELVLKYRLLLRVRDQLREFLVGFYEVVPEALLSVFDFQELELLMCGLPTIQLADWQQHTLYVGEFERKGAAHKVVRWFWEVLNEFADEQKARLLQFVTGTSGVPSQGFAVLQGNDGNIRKFTINGVSVEGGLFPRAHTCFNRIDLPVYESRADLKQYLSLAIQLEATGFDIE